LVFFTAGASRWTQTLCLGMMREVFYYWDMADGLRSHSLMFFLNQVPVAAAELEPSALG